MSQESIQKFIQGRPWAGSRPPKRILAIRLQAMGDVVISLPYLQQLRETLPKHTRLDFLVLRESSPIPSNLQLFDRIFIIDGGRRFKLQLLFTMPMLVWLLLRRYEVVLDVQNSPISRLVRKTLRPKAWCEFDKFSTLPAGERTRTTIEAAGFPLRGDWPSFCLRSDLGATELLRKGGWDGTSSLVVLNPGGAFPSRHWPEEYYIRFAKGWADRHPATQFLFIGIARMADMASKIQEGIGSGVINLIGKTTAAQAFAMIQKVSFVLSEDSGLMHIAWVSGIPTLALFGSSRSDWARPLGPHSAFLDGMELECAPCKQETCQFGDNRCLTRHGPEEVLGKALQLLCK